MATKKIPDSICAMMDIPEDISIRKYIQDYKLNLIKLRKLSKKAGKFVSVQIFSILQNFYLRGIIKKLSKELKTSSQILTHTKDTLHTLASITGDQRYLTAQESYKEGLAVCEVAETLFQMGVEESKKSSNSKSRFSPSAKYDCRKNAEIERLRAENERLKQTQ